MYADDTQHCIKLSFQDDIRRLDETLRKTQDWLAHNHFKLNPQKTELIIFAPTLRSQQPHPCSHNIKSLNSTLTICDSIKSLGITRDSNQNMQDHLQAGTSNVNLHLTLLRKLKPFIPLGDLKTAVQSLVLSRLNYGNATFIGIPKASLAPIKVAINAAARLNQHILLYSVAASTEITWLSCRKPDDFGGCSNAGTV